MANDVQHRAGVVAKREQVDTEIDYILLDASGSMASNWLGSLDAIDAYVTRINSLRTNVILASFTTSGDYSSERFDYQILQESGPDKWVPAIGVKVQMGSTPLFDAINTMGRELRDMNPAKCSILIVTDGAENASKTTLLQAQSILNWCRAKGWQVTFLGCDFNNLTQAKELGANAATAIGVSAKRLRDVTGALADKRTNYSRTGNKMSFTDDEKESFGGYLSPPK